MNEIVNNDNLPNEEKMKEILKIFGHSFETRSILTEIKANLKDNKDKELSENVGKLMRVYESQTHYSLIESFDERYRGLAKELAQKLIFENNCQSETEKTLAEVMVNAYIRLLDCSRRLNNELNAREITPNRNQYIGNLSKQVDRAHRQYIQSLTALKQFKNPSVELKINATNAFLSNNQQVNIKDDEIIKSI